MTHRQTAGVEVRGVRGDVIAAAHPIEGRVLRAVEPVDGRGRTGGDVKRVALVRLRAGVGERDLQSDGGDLLRVALVVERVFLADLEAVRLRAFTDDRVAVAAKRVRQAGVFAGVRAERADGGLPGVVELDVLAALREVLFAEGDRLGDAAAQVGEAQFDLRGLDGLDLLRGGRFGGRRSGYGGRSFLAVHDDLALAGGRAGRGGARRG